MSIKVIAIALALVLVAVAVAAWVGHMRGTDAATLACTQAHAGDATKLANAATASEAKARIAQAAEDKQELDTVRGMMQDAQLAAAKASATAAAAKERSDQLNKTLTRLQHDDAQVDKWASACLPGSLLASMHPGITLANYPSACRTTAGSNQGAVPAGSR